jgi:DNA-binding response OmpR family regulator
MKPKILFIEDELDLGKVVKQYLEISEFDVDWQLNGKAALEQFKQHKSEYQILLIDVSMPEMDGFEFAEKVINMEPNIPFLFLTARNEKADRLRGLKIGADDYISKPFDIDEVVLRIKNIIKRNNFQVSEPVNRPVIERGDVSFYKDSLQLFIAGQKEITLTPREAELLDHLFKNENRILKRENILTQLWGENDYFLGRSLDVFVSRLRKHLNRSNYVSINNIYGVGFVFTVKES